MAALESPSAFCIPKHNPSQEIIPDHFRYSTHNNSQNERTMTCFAGYASLAYDSSKMCGCCEADRQTTCGVTAITTTPINL